VTATPAAGPGRPATEPRYDTRDIGDPDQQAGIRLYTPGEAAARLAVRESWLRRKAGQRQVPCTMLGKHLRFSDADLHAITHAAARPATTPTRRTPTRRNPGHRA
jgi:excisionase family DNA binding protein